MFRRSQNGKPRHEDKLKNCYSYSMDVTSNVSMGTFITLSQIRVNILSCFICFVYVKVPQCRNEDIDQSVPET